MIKLYVSANVARLANDNAGAVIDEEAGANASAGVNVDSGFGMSMFRHHAWDERHSQKQQLVSNAINGDGFHAGIAKDNLRKALGGRVAFESSLGVEFQPRAHVRQALQ